jgi:VWFA-related protein
MQSISAIGEVGRLLSPACVPMNRGVCSGSLIWDSLEIANRTVLNKLEGRKAVILITDGWDVGSYATLDQSIRIMQESNTAVYTIRYDAAEMTVGPNAIMYENNLKRLSEATGALSIKAPRNLDGPFAEIESELRNQYLATFQVPESARDGRLHELFVETRRKGLKVHARAAYRAPKR